MCVCVCVCFTVPKIYLKKLYVAAEEQKHLNDDLSCDESDRTDVLECCLQVSTEHKSINRHRTSDLNDAKCMRLPTDNGSEVSVQQIDSLEPTGHRKRFEGHPDHGNEV